MNNFTLKFYTKLILILILFPLLLNAQSKNDVLKISHLTSNFYIYTTYHDYKGVSVSANGLYLVTDDGVVMLDTPWDTTQFQPLLDSIKQKHNKNVIMCIATHSHEDRTAGLEYYRSHGIKTYTTRQTDSICKVNNNKRAEYLIENDTVFSIGQYTFQTFYGGPGHTPDNIVIWFPKEKILYGGCLIKSTDAVDLGNLNDANPKEWITTIKNIQTQFGKPDYVISGHQSWANSKSLDHTLKMLKQFQ